MLRREYGSHDSVNLHLSVPPTTEVTGLYATKFELPVINPVKTGRNLKAAALGRNILP